MLINRHRLHVVPLFQCWKIKTAYNYLLSSHAVSPTMFCAPKWSTKSSWWFKTEICSYWWGSFDTSQCIPCVQAKYGGPTGKNIRKIWPHHIFKSLIIFGTSWYLNFFSGVMTILSIIEVWNLQTMFGSNFVALWTDLTSSGLQLISLPKIIIWILERHFVQDSLCTLHT